MGLFSFIKEAGEKLFGGKEVEAAAAQAASNPAPLQDLNDKAARAIEAYIASQNLGCRACRWRLTAPAARWWFKARPPRRKPRKKSPCAAATWPV